MNKKFIMVAICSIAGILLICGCMQTSKNTKDSQKGSELEAVDTMHILQVGEKAFDAELFDMQGNKHRLFEAFADGRYVLLDFWNLHCGACRGNWKSLLSTWIQSLSGKGMNGARRLYGRTGMTGESSRKEVSRAAITTSMLYPSTSYCRPMAVFFGRWLVMA